MHFLPHGPQSCHLTRDESVELMQSLSGSGKAVVTAAELAQKKTLCKLGALLPSRKWLGAAIVSCMFNQLCLEPVGKEAGLDVKHSRHS